MRRGLKRAISITVAIAVMVTIIVAVFFGYIPEKYDYHIGSVATKDIYAARNVIDNYQTHYDAVLAKNSTKTILVRNTDDSSKNINNIKSFFQIVRQERANTMDEYGTPVQDYVGVRNELIEKLKNNYSEKTAVTVADLMCEYGYVNDDRYAEKLAKQYITVRKYGKSRAALMMRQKLLDAQTIETALDKYTEDDITGEIAEILRKKYFDRLFLGGIEGKKEMQKVIAALARRGYGYNDIKTALYIIQDEIQNEED